MTYSVWVHQCERPWPGPFRCRDIHLAGPVSLPSAQFFVHAHDGFGHPRQPLRIQHGDDVEWSNDVTARCAQPSQREETTHE